MTKKRKRPPLPVLAYLQAVSAPEAPCPDCNERAVGRELRHEDSCPLQNGVEDVCAADAQWFRDHPGEDMYERPITNAEVQQMRHTDPAAAGATHVLVIRHSWGRTRGFVRGNDVRGIMLDLDGAA